MGSLIVQSLQSKGPLSDVPLYCYHTLPRSDETTQQTGTLQLAVLSWIRTPIPLTGAESSHCNGAFIALEGHGSVFHCAGQDT